MTKRRESKVFILTGEVNVYSMNTMVLLIRGSFEKKTGLHLSPGQSVKVKLVMVGRVKRS